MDYGYFVVIIMKGCTNTNNCHIVNTNILMTFLKKKTKKLKHHTQNVCSHRIIARRFIYKKNMKHFVFQMLI